MVAAAAVAQRHVPRGSCGRGAVGCSFPLPGCVRPMHACAAAASAERHGFSWGDDRQPRGETQAARDAGTGSAALSAAAAAIRRRRRRYRVGSSCGGR